MSIKDYIKLFSASSATAALSLPAVSNTIPAKKFDTQDLNGINLIFGGTSIAGQTINYQVIGWTQYANTAVWVPKLIAKGVATLGSLTMGTTGASLASSATLFADSITDTSGQQLSNLFNVTGNISTLQLNVSGIKYITVETDVATAVTASVYAQNTKFIDTLVQEKVGTVTTVVSVSTSATLATLLSRAILDSTRTITLRPHATGIYMNSGVATTSTDPLGTSAIVISGGKLSVKDLQFYAESATGLTVIEEG